MKNKAIDITFILLVTIILLMVTLIGCTSSRKVQKNELKQTTETEVKQATEVRNDVTTTRNNEITSTTTTRECVDTVVSVVVAPTGNAKLDSFLRNKPLQVAVKLNRSTIRQEYRKENELSTDKTVMKNDQSVQKTEKTVQKAKNVETKGSPWWLFAGLGALMVVVAYLAYRYIKNRVLL